MVVHGPEIIDSGGAVDGDLDRLAGYITIQPGSVVFWVMPGHDDLVGRQVKAEIFRGVKRICNRAGDLAKRVKKLAGERLVRNGTDQILLFLDARSSWKKTVAVAVSPRPTVIFGFRATRDGIKDMISSPV
jgi:hypothetical protein